MLARKEWSALVDQTSGAPWFALRCRGRLAREPGKEKPLVTSCLEDLGLEVYHPILRELRPLPKKRLSYAQRMSGVPILRMRIVSLFPGVSFIRETRAIDWERVFGLSSVFGFLAIGEEPCRLAHKDIIRLRSREIDGVIAGSTPANLIFKAGDDIVVRDGPLTTSLGKIEEAPDLAIEDIDGETRLKIMVEMMGRKVSISLRADQIEKL